MKHDINILRDSTIEAKGNLHSNHTKSVMVIYPNGKIVTYTSVDDVGKALQTHPSYVSTCLSNGKQCRGCTVIHTSNAISFLGQIIAVNNKNASDKESLWVDANAYRQQQAEAEAARKAEEKRLEEERKAEEEKQKEIAKLDVAINNLEVMIQRKEHELICLRETKTAKEQRRAELQGNQPTANNSNEDEVWTA